MPYVDKITENGIDYDLYSIPVANAIAEEFDSTKTYSAGDLVFYETVLYQFKVDHVAGAWAANQVEIVKVGNEITDLTEKMQYCNIKTIPGSKNLWDSATAKVGFITANGTIHDDSSSYYYNEINVEPGDIVYCSIPGNVRYMRFICAYNENGQAEESKGSGSDINGFVVKDGTVKLAISIVAGIKDTVMITLNDNTVPVTYINYMPQTFAYVATDEFLQDVNSLTEASFRSEYMTDKPRNILNPLDSDLELQKLIIYNSGNTVEHSSYYTTGYMPVKEGRTYYFWTNLLLQRGVRAIAAFDASKRNLPSAGINDGSTGTYKYYVNSGVSFIRISFPYRTDDIVFNPTGNMVIADETPQKFLPYKEVEKYVFDTEYMPNIKPALHVYLPDEICVGIGRTIELYNELVCLESDKYHLHYTCNVGIQYKRKWSLTGTRIGTYSLTLQIYDDNMNMVWIGTSTIKVVANNISNQLKILPIGDSLTNLKDWLGEVQTLSDGKILYIGTRGRNDSNIRCEGRSGFTAADYLANTSYTFDNNYQGNPNVQGTVNPFWNGSRFSIAYYNTQQASVVGTPDAIEILLGTNDVFSGSYTAEECAEHITDIIDNIRQDDISIPIFVCNTIYRSNQNGYYSSGGQGFSAARGWAFDSDMKIMAFQNALVSAIKAKNYNAVYIVPCSVCMDRENDFGQVEVAVNPRLQNVTVTIPSESVHPQNAGYYQMADVMYSSFIAHLN